MKTELKVISSLWSKPDADGITHCIKKNIITRREVHVEDILSHEEIYNEKGVILKTQCVVILDKQGMTVVKHSYDYISNVVDKREKMKQIGFKYKNRK